MTERNLSAEQFAVIERTLARGKRRSPHKAARDRLFIEAVLLHFRTGTPWSQLGAQFGPGSRVKERFLRWTTSHQWKHLLHAFDSEPGVPAPSGLHEVAAEEARVQPIPRQQRKRGFATMSQERRREIARKGGASVAPENRSFSRDRDLAARAGMIGGEVSPLLKAKCGGLGPDRKSTSDSGSAS